MQTETTYATMGEARKHVTPGETCVSSIQTPDGKRFVVTPVAAGLIEPRPVKCDRCNCKIDGTHYTQVERGNIGPVTAHYCNDCAALLRTMGEMSQRRTDRPDNTPWQKGD